MFRMTHLASAIAAASLTTIPAYAQTNNELEPVIVTATRTAQTADQTIAPVTIITAEEIKKSASKNLPELLQGRAGLHTTSNGGYGQVSSVHLRGTNSAHVLVLVDGMKISSAANGAAAWQNIPISQIKRIEIVRGPRSTLYGSQAIGGVIQIFTIATEKKDQKIIDISVGNDGIRKVDVSGTKKIEDLTLSLGASFFEETSGSTLKQDQYYYMPDDDKSQNKSLVSNLSYSLDPKNEIRLSWLYAEGKNEYDGADTTGWFPADKTNKDITNVVNFDWLTLPAAFWESKVKFGFSEDLTEDSISGSLNTRRHAFSQENVLNLSPALQVNFGVDYINDKISATTVFSNTERYEKAIFLQSISQIENNEFLAGIRALKNEQFGSKSTYSLEWKHNFNDNLSLTAAHGSSFAAPTFNDLYYPDDGPWDNNDGTYTTYSANPNLDAETSKSWEIGLQSGSLWSVSIYKTEIDNLISNQLGDDPNIADPAYLQALRTNVNKAAIIGAEIELETKLLSTEIGLNLTYLDARDEALYKNNKLPRRPEFSFLLKAEQKISGIDSAISVRGQNHSYENVTNTTKLPGFAIVDLTFRKSISDSAEGYLKISNLLDKEYSTVNGYNMPGSQVSVGVHAEF